MPPPLHWSLKAAMGGAGIALLAVACAHPQTNSSNNTSYVVSAASTSFFKYGPAQEFGPDFTMASGQRLTLIHREFGYSRVMTENGISGYVSNDDIKPAPPTPPPKPTPKSSIGSWFKHTPSSTSNFKPVPQPLFDVNDVPPPPMPPAGEKPHSAGPTPGFRY
jgi:hypothetical protein